MRSRADGVLIGTSHTSHRATQPRNLNNSSPCMDILIWTFLAIVLLLNYPSIVPYLVGINKTRRIWNAKSQIIPAVVADELKICMCMCKYCDCLMKKLSRYFYFDQCGVGQWLELMIDFYNSTPYHWSTTSTFHIIEMRLNAPEWGQHQMSGVERLLAAAGALLIWGEWLELESAASRAQSSYPLTTPPTLDSLDTALINSVVMAQRHMENREWLN